MILLIIFLLFFLNNFYATASRTQIIHPKKRPINYSKVDFRTVKQYNDSQNPNKAIDSQAYTDVRYRPYERSSFESKKQFLNGYTQEDDYFTKIFQFVKEMRENERDNKSNPDQIVTFYTNLLERISQHGGFLKQHINQLIEFSLKKDLINLQENVQRNDSFPCHLESDIIEAESPQNIYRPQNSATQLATIFSMTNDRSKTFQQRDLSHSDLNQQLFYDKSDETNIEEDDHINYIEKTGLINRNKFKDSKNLTMKRDSEVIQANNEVLKDINAQKIVRINDKPTGYRKNEQENPKFTSICETNNESVSETVNTANNEKLCQNLMVSTPSTGILENNISKNYDYDRDSAFEKEIKGIINEDKDLEDKKTKLLFDFGTVFKINIGDSVFQSGIEGTPYINCKFYIVKLFLDSVINDDHMRCLCIKKNEITIEYNTNMIQFRCKKDNIIYNIKNINANKFYIFEKKSINNKAILFEFDLYRQKLVNELLLKLKRNKFLSDLLPEYNICEACESKCCFFKNELTRIFLSTCLMNKHLQWIKIMEGILEMDYNYDSLNENNLLFFKKYLQSILRKFIFKGLKFFFNEETLADLKKVYKIA